MCPAGRRGRCTRGSAGGVELAPDAILQGRYLPLMGLPQLGLRQVRLKHTLGDVIT